jgi:aspartate/methionine/tyrosine aminotransferase
MIEKLEDSIKKQNKAVLILNFPNNPTGYVPVKETVKKIVKGLDELGTKYKRPIVVFCDDAYEGYVYHEDSITVSLFYELVGLNEYIIPLKLDGSSKEMLMYGGRIAAVTLGLNDKWYTSENLEDFVKEVENKFQAVIRSTVSNSNRFIQSTLIKMFKGGIEKIIEERKKIIDIVGERYVLINTLLSEIKSDAISVDPNHGGFFLLINIDKKVKATDFNEHLLKKYKTGLIPIVKQDQNINCLRIAYSSIPKSQIPQLVENIKNTLIDLNL